jgi:hypothetical protein
MKKIACAAAAASLFYTVWENVKKGDKEDEERCGLNLG